MRDNVTAHYTKSDTATESDINYEAKLITEKLDISDRVEPIAQKSAYITIKDHKEDFPNNVKCRLINPAKSNIGKISQQILQDINQKIRDKLNLQQWRSTADTLNWFKNLKNKKQLKFIQLDIVDFYPSITEELFNSTLDFASETVHINTDTKTLLRNARKSILFHNNDVWKKSTGLFDVTMGSYDGCELCELVGLYVIHKMKQKFPEINFGLYRDDGLGTITKTPKSELERLNKKLFKMFKTEFGLSITIETNLTVVNYLDVTLDLHNEKFYPYRKPNDHPLYIHKDSNHPPHVTKQLPISINKRLSSISCNKQAFDSFKGDYEKALADSALRSKLKYEPQAESASANQPKNRTRKRNVIWFTPPYNAALKTNLGKEFLKLIDKNFPKNHHLSKILNRKTLKISYSCTPSMQSVIQTHNKKILTAQQKNTNARCNCQNKQSCPTPGECCQEEVVYHATVTHTNGSTAEYIGCTETSFKKRFANHKKAFNTKGIRVKPPFQNMCGIRVSIRRQMCHGNT